MSGHSIWSIAALGVVLKELSLKITNLMGTSVEIETYEIVI